MRTSTPASRTAFAIACMSSGPTALAADEHALGARAGQDLAELLDRAEQGQSEVARALVGRDDADRPEAEGGSRHDVEQTLRLVVGSDDHGAERERAPLAQVAEPGVPQASSGQREQERERPRRAHPGAREIGLQPERQEHHDGDRGRDGQDDPTELLGGREPVRLVEMRRSRRSPAPRTVRRSAAGRSPWSASRPRSGSSRRRPGRTRSRARRWARPSRYRRR